MKRRRQVRIEMTSLMDVMFLVLVFFIYCIFDMSVHKGVTVELPNAAGAPEQGERTAGRGYRRAGHILRLGPHLRRGAAGAVPGQGARGAPAGLPL